MPRVLTPSSQAAPRATVAAGFVSGMLSGLAAQNIDPGPLLLAADLDPRLMSEPAARVPLTAYAELYNHVVASLGDEGFGLFSVPLKPGMFEYLCRSMVGSRDLGEALQRAAGFLRLVLPDLALTQEKDGALARLEIAETGNHWASPDDPRRVFAFEWLLRLLHGLCCWLVGRSLALESVQFPYAQPAHAADYALIYTEHPGFGGDVLVARFRAALLALPVRRDMDAVAAFLEGAPGKIAMLYRRDHEMVRQIREILSLSPGQSLSLREVAERLHLSLRTVQRRLKQEGVSYRGIKAGLRRNLALSIIGQTRKPVSQVALELGYAETSAFFRAFVGWTGEAPTAYRKRLRVLTS